MDGRAPWQGGKKPRDADKLPAIASSGWLAILDAGDGSPGAIGVPDAPTGVQPVEIPLTDGRRVLALACGAGEYTSYWAVDANDKPICLVVDAGAFTQKEWKAKPSSV